MNEALVSLRSKPNTRDNDIATTLQLYPRTAEMVKVIAAYREEIEAKIRRDGLIRYDKTYASLVAGLRNLSAHEGRLDIKAPGVEFVIQKMCVKAQTARDVATDRRTRESKAYLEPLEEVRARWRPLVDGFDELFRKLKRMGGDVLKARRDEEDKKRAEAVKRLEEAKQREKDSLKDEARNAVERHDALHALRDARDAVAALAPVGAPIGVKTEQGSLFGCHVWKWRMEKLEDVPDTYLQRYVDPKKVDLAVSNGVRNIPGILIYDENEMKSRRAGKS